MWKVETSKVETSWNVEELKVEKMKGWTIETCIFLTKHRQLKFETWKIEKARVFENVKCSSVRSKSKGETWKHWIFNMFKLSTCQLLTTPLTDRNGKFKVETVEKLKSWKVESWNVEHVEKLKNRKLKQVEWLKSWKLKKVQQLKIELFHQTLKSESWSSCMPLSCVPPSCIP